MSIEIKTLCQLNYGIPYNIQSDVIQEKERLKNECNQLILDLGISDFTHRQSNLQLKK